MEENQKVIEFTEELNVEDLQYANYFNFRRQKRYLFNQVIFIGMSLLLMGFSFVEEEWLLLGVGAVLLVFSVVFFLPLYKKMIYNAVKKNMTENLNIRLRFTELGFIYTLADNPEEETPDYKYSQIVKGYILPDYIYLYFNNSAIAIVKKESCSNLDELKGLLEEQLGEKFEEIIKVPR